MLHSCGHTEHHSGPKGPKWRKERDAGWQASRPCTACWSEQQAAEAEAACGVTSLPPLKGTEAQVRWARSIRVATLGRLKGQAAELDRMLAEWGDAPASKPFLDQATALALDERRAKWWIDMREEVDAMSLFLPLQALHAFQELQERAQPAPF